MLKLEYIPNGIGEILEYYGSPGKVERGRFVVDRNWIADNLAWFGFAFPLRQSWDLKEIRGFYIHKKIGPVMIDAIEEIHEIYGLSYMRRHGLDYWGDCHNPRLKRTNPEPSTHAWAIAIDYVPALGALEDPPTTPWFVVEAFTKRGFSWGGLWDHSDGMHFQACEGY